MNKKLIIVLALAGCACFAAIGVTVVYMVGSINRYVEATPPKPPPPAARVSSAGSAPTKEAKPPPPAPPPPVAEVEELPDHVKEVIASGKVIDGEKSVSQNLSNLVSMSEWQLKQMDTNSAQYKQANMALNMLGNILKDKSISDIDGLANNPIFQKGLGDLNRVQSNAFRNADEHYDDLLDELE